MDKKKSNVISLQDRKPSVFQTKIKAAREISKRARGGGRCLDAVWERTDLSTGEKSVLCQIGAFHDFRLQWFSKPVLISMKKMALRTSLTVRGVRKILRQLEDKGLIISVARQKRNGGADISAYRMLPKLFVDYARQRLLIPEGRSSGGEELSSGGDEQMSAANEELSPGGEELSSVGSDEKYSETIAGGGTQFREGGNSVPEGEELSSVLFPILIPSPVSKEIPPIVPPEMGDAEKVKISRYDKTNYQHLLDLSINAWIQWNRYEGKPDFWDNSGYRSYRDLLASYYPELVLRLMPKLGPKWDKGIARNDIHYWYKQMHQEVQKMKAHDVLGIITDYEVLELHRLVAHGMQARGEGSVRPVSEAGE